MSGDDDDNIIDIASIKKQLDEQYLYVTKELEKYYQIMKLPNILKFRKDCDGIYNSVDLQKLRHGIRCFNTQLMYLKLLQTETYFVDTHNHISKESYTRDQIITQNGYRWFKIINKDKETIKNSLDENYDVKFCILDVVQKFVDTALNSGYLPFDYIPELVILLYDMPDEYVCKEIKKIYPKLNIKTIDDLPLQPQHNIEFETNILNIDVNILITLCSEAGYLPLDIKLEEIHCRRMGISREQMNKYTDREMIEIVNNNRQIILEVFKKYPDKIVCQSAFDIFAEAITKGGGKNEKQRFDDICKSIKVVSDCKSSRINKCSHPSSLANAIFGTGDTYKAITITSFGNFLNYAQFRGLHIVSKYVPSCELMERYLKIENT
jgi:Protein of unknown function (DUF1308)